MDATQTASVQPKLELIQGLPQLGAVPAPIVVAAAPAIAAKPAPAPVPSPASAPPHRRLWPAQWLHLPLLLLRCLLLHLLQQPRLWMPLP